MKDNGRFMKTIGRMTVAGMVAALLAPPAAAEEPYEVLWGRLVGTAGSDSGSGVAADGEGNVVFCGTLDYSSQGVGIAILSKYGPAGDLLWSHQLGAPRSVWAHAVEIDAFGNIYLGGSTFLAKYDGQGEPLWERQFGTYDMDVDPAGNIVLTGARSFRKYDSSGELLWDREKMVTALALDGAGDIYVCDYTYIPSGVSLAKYSAAGDELWVRQLTTSDDLWVGDVAVSRTGDVYIGGDVYRSFGDHYDAWLMKCDPEGVLLWSRGYDGGRDERWSGVAVDVAGNAYVAGSSSPTFGHPEGWPSMKVAKYDRQGNLLWLPDNPLGMRWGWGRSAAVDAAGNLYISGGADRLFGIPGAGGGDAFVAKFRPACYADCDGSGGVDFFDFLCFQGAFSVGDPYADCDGSGGFDFLDFLCFQNAFAAGCPE